MATVTVRVRSRVRDVKEQARARAEKAIRKAAFDIEADAKAFAPVDTGYLKNTIQAEPDGTGINWRVTSYAEYSIYVEFGTYAMAPQPYLLPAAEFVRPELEAALRRIV